MSTQRTSALRLSRTAGALAVGALLLGLAGMSACTPYSTLKDVPVDCTADVGYEFLYFETGTSTPPNDPVSAQGNWWGAGDTPPADGGTSRAFSTIDQIPDGGLCGSKTADVLHTYYYNDWGSLFGDNNFKTTGAELYDGISFWARAPGNTTKGFSILLDDDNTASIAGSNCKQLPADAGAQGQVTGISYDPSTGTVISGSASAAPLPDQCGNDYSVAMVVTSEWHFYTIPFSKFQQADSPNRVPNAALTEVGNVAGTGLLTSKLRTLVLRMPREAEMDLWLSNLAFYRKGAGNGPDAGPDSALR